MIAGGPSVDPGDILIQWQAKRQVNMGRIPGRS